MLSSDFTNPINKPLTVACIPAYNEEKTIAKVVLLTKKYVDKVIVCDDGSADLTSDIAAGLGADVIKHNGNGGYGRAIQSIFKRARDLGADVLVTLDGDGQHDPNEIPTLLKPILEEGVDVVVGSRFIEDNGKNDAPLYRRIGIKVITSLTNIASNSRVTDAQSGYRAYSRKVLEELEIDEDGMGVSVEILMNAGKSNFKVVEVPVGCDYRGLDTSTYNPLIHAIDVVKSIIKLIIEDKPLFVLGLPGAVLLLGGILFGVWMLHIYALEQRIITSIAFASLAFTLIGLFTVFTSITLYAIARLMRKMRKITNHTQKQLPRNKRKKQSKTRKLGI